MTHSSVTVSHELVLAVDAGGTKSIACLARIDVAGSPTILGRGRATAGNPLSVPFHEAMRAIGEAVQLARREAGETKETVARAVLSIAGAASGDMQRRIIAWAHTTQLADKVAIVADILPVLAAGTPNGIGVALVCGTGSVVIGRSAGGRTIRVGGWGYLLGDDGSGYSIGRAALRRALADLELNRPLRSLSRRMLAALAVDSVAQLTGKIHSSPNPRTTMAALTPLVLDAAESGDPDAIEIIDTAARELAELVRRATTAVDLTEDKFTLALGGSVLVGSRRLQEQVRSAVRNLSLTCEIAVVEDPLIGCLQLAIPDFAPGLIQWN